MTDKSEKSSIFNQYIEEYSPKIWVSIDKTNLSPEDIKASRSFDANFYRIKKSSQNVEYDLMYLTIYKNFILLARDNNSEPLAAIDVRFATMKYNELAESKNGKYYSISIIKLNRFEEIIAKTKDEIMVLYEYLKYYCVQTNMPKYYEPLDGLGKGGYCKVFTVKRKTDNKLFAVKQFDTKKYVNSNNQILMLNELYILTLLRESNYENVLKMEGIYEGQNYVYLITELIEGGELITYVNENLINGTLTDNLQIQIINSVAKAIQPLSELNILHRDLKLSNVMLRKPNDPTDIVAVDYGLSLALNFQTLTKIMYKIPAIGTPGYIAPELFTARVNEINCISDVFSLGCMTYTIKTSNSIFRTTEIKSQIKANREPKIDIENDYLLNKIDCSDQKKQLQTGMLEINPKNRMTLQKIISMTEIKTDLLNKDKSTSDSLHIMPMQKESDMNVNHEEELIHIQNDSNYHQNVENATGRVQKDSQPSQNLTGTKSKEQEMNITCNNLQFSQKQNDSVYYRSVENTTEKIQKDFQLSQNLTIPDITQKNESPIEEQFNEENQFKRSIDNNEGGTPDKLVHFNNSVRQMEKISEKIRIQSEHFTKDVFYNDNQQLITPVQSKESSPIKSPLRLEMDKMDSNEKHELLAFKLDTEINLNIKNESQLTKESIQQSSHNLKSDEMIKSDQMISDCDQIEKNDKKEALRLDNGKSKITRKMTYDLINFLNLPQETLLSTVKECNYRFTPEYKSRSFSKNNENQGIMKYCNNKDQKECIPEEKNDDINIKPKNNSKQKSMKQSIKSFVRKVFKLNKD